MRNRIKIIARKSVLWVCLAVGLMTAGIFNLWGRYPSYCAFYHKGGPCIQLEICSPGGCNVILDDDEWYISVCIGNSLGFAEPACS